MKTAVATWSEVAGTYDLSFGKAIPHQKLKPRGFWGDIVNVGKGVLDAAQGDADVSKSVSFDVNVGTPGQKTNIYTDDKGRFSLDCIDCYVSGSWGVEGHLTVENFVLQDLILEASPSDFKAKLELEATVTSSKSPESIQNSKELFSAPIPGAGISVTGIFKLGATVSYEVGTSATFAGSATADFGLSASLPNGAKVVAAVNHPTDSSATGWSGSSLTPNFEVTKLSASITLAAFSQPKIAFGIELVEVGKVDVAVTMKLPEISSTLSANYGMPPPTVSNNDGTTDFIPRCKRSLPIQQLKDRRQTRKQSRRITQPTNRPRSRRRRQETLMVTITLGLLPTTRLRLHPLTHPRSRTRRLDQRSTRTIYPSRR